MYKLKLQGLIKLVVLSISHRAKSQMEGGNLFKRSSPKSGTVVIGLSFLISSFFMP